ncbi:MAG: hypothetical protein ACR2GX_00780 [Candidatus Dormibacteria bacterium]
METATNGVELDPILDIQFPNSPPPPPPSPTATPTPPPHTQGGGNTPRRAISAIAAF